MARSTDLYKLERLPMDLIVSLNGTTPHFSVGGKYMSEHFFSGASVFAMAGKLQDMTNPLLNRDWMSRWFPFCVN